MTIHIAFLRGINVGGNHRMKMADLRNMFLSMGIERVQTYIQSGNVLFDSSEEVDILRQRIEEEIKKNFSIPIAVVLRTSLELEHIIADCPFSEAVRREAEASAKAETFYVAIMSESPSREGIEELRKFTSETEKFQIRHREVYLLLREGVRNSKLANNLFRLKTPITMRNWKTVNKLGALAKAMR